MQYDNFRGLLCHGNNYSYFLCKVENVVTRIFENDIDIQKVEFHGFIRMITRKELSNDLVEKIEGRDLGFQ